jgi:FkbM family methyltransferase
VNVHAFEPGPPNYRLFEMNRLANPDRMDRIHLHREAVAAANATVDWFFDEANPGGSSLYGGKGKSFPVTIRAFNDVVAEIGGNITLAKIDIEGAEFDLLRGTPAATWEKVSAVALELHDDPAGQMSQGQFLDRFKALGFVIEEESVCSFFLHR